MRRIFGSGLRELMRRVRKRRKMNLMMCSYHLRKSRRMKMRTSRKERMTMRWIVKMKAKVRMRVKMMKLMKNSKPKVKSWMNNQAHSKLQKK